MSVARPFLVLTKACKDLLKRQISIKVWGIAKIEDISLSNSEDEWRDASPTYFDWVLGNSHMVIIAYCQLL